MWICLLSCILLCLAEVPNCPPSGVSQEECLSVDGCFFSNTSKKALCLVQCTLLTSVEECNDPRSSKCYWNEEHQSCAWIYNCGSPRTVEKCIPHPSVELSCIWDTTDPTIEPSCRTAKCYDYNAEPARCIGDDNLECVLDKGWCRDLTCPEIDNINDCHDKVGDSCAWQNGACVQVPCAQWKNSSQCIAYGFCRWHRDTNTCAKAQCVEIRDQAGCEGFYTEKYVASCAWNADSEECFEGHICKDFTTKIGCLVGGGPCVWTPDKHCVDL